MTEETVQTERVELSGGVFAGILLLSAAVLALEVYLTRVYSLMVWPYMAFVVVSVAMLGIGAAAAVLAPRRADNAGGRAVGAVGFLPGDAVPVGDNGHCGAREGVDTVGVGC